MTPISKLSGDVLFEIFSYNATLIDDPPLFRSRLKGSAYGPARYPSYPKDVHDARTGLLSTRRTSQVCQQWREVLLKASSLWGRLLNINYLRQGDGFWRQEVLRRTGEAPLRIQADLFFSVDRGDAEVVTMNAFFHSILEKHWSRVESLELRIFDDYSDSSRKTVELLQRPAPALKNFSYSILQGMARRATPCTSIPQLFADEAPSLRSYFSSNLITFQPDKPWMTNLRELAVYPPNPGNGSNFRPVYYSLRQLLTALSRMTWLESISLSYNFARFKTIPLYESTANMPTVRLPHVKSISLNSDPLSCHNFLRSIDVSAPAPGWSLRIEGMDSLYPEPKNELLFSLGDLVALLDTILLYLKGYMTVHSVPNLTMHIEESHVHLAHEGGSNWFKLATPPLSHFKALAPSFLPELATLRLETVTYISLIISDVIFGLAPEELAKVVASLVGVETLETDLPTLELHSSLPPHPSGIFPALREVRISDLSDMIDTSRDCSFTPLVDFLALRKDNSQMHKVMTVNLGKVGGEVHDSSVPIGAQALSENGFEDVKIMYRSPGGDKHYDPNAPRKNNDPNAPREYTSFY